MLVEILVPAPESPIVMPPQAFHIQHVEAVLGALLYDLPEAGHHAAGEDVLFDPGVFRVLLPCADKLGQIPAVHEFHG